MSINIVLLTTDTSHHLYFAWKIHERFPLTGILTETNVLKAGFDTAHPLENKRDEFERSTLLKGAPATLRDIAETVGVGNTNDADALVRLNRWAPDWILVFGTGLLKKAVIQKPKKGILNLHGGDSERYRGLDSHYWTIYHRDFAHLTTTLHVVDETFDTGNIVGQKTLALKRGMELFQLRALNTQACVDLSLMALEEAATTSAVRSRKQKEQGRYYSFMPSVLKDVCVKNFNEHVARL